MVAGPVTHAHRNEEARILQKQVVPSSAFRKNILRRTGTLGAVLIFFLYSISEQGQELYPTTWILWSAIVPMTLWMVRMVMLGWFGKQDYDPIVFAMRDKLGIGLLMITLSLMFWAAGL